MPSRQHWAYAWVPLFGAFVWFSMLLALLITWLAQGRPHYVSQEERIAYISDIGADILKPLFIVGCSTTGITFFVSLVIERWLRNEGRLLPRMKKQERVLSSLAILGSFIGAVGLILLSILDTKRYRNIHKIFLLLFIIGVGLSGVFTVIEYHWISIDYPDVRRLRISYRIKGVIVSVLILLSIALGVTLKTSRDVGAVLEWIIGFGFTFYLLTFFYDLRMTGEAQKGELGSEKVEVAGQDATDVRAVKGDHVAEKSHSNMGTVSSTALSNITDAETAKEGHATEEGHFKVGTNDSTILPDTTDTDTAKAEDVAEQSHCKVGTASSTVHSEGDRDADSTVKEEPPYCFKEADVEGTPETE